MTDRSLLRLRCEAVGHVPVDTDPTGGDPWMGGPVLITVCDRCGIELEHSERARTFNDSHPYDPQITYQMTYQTTGVPPAPPKRHWWSRRS